MENNTLDQLMIQHGTEITEEPTLVNKDVIKQHLHINSFAYDSNTPIPGEAIDNRINDAINEINENTALDSLISQAAIIKAKNAKSHKLTKQEREKYKETFCAQLLQQQEEAYFNKYGFIMDGKTKRYTRKSIEKNFNKGKYDKYLTNNHTSLNG